MILSLYWPKLTALGAKCSMVAGFLMVPLMQFAVPPLLKAVNMETLAGYLADLDVLLPAFAVGFGVAVVVSVFDKKGQKQVEGIGEELAEASKDSS